MDFALLDKYLKVKALAVGGSAGEKENAKRILSKMESENPGIAKAAAAYAKKLAAEEQQSDPEPGVWGQDHNNWGETRTRSSGWNQDAAGNWENLFKAAQAAWSGMYGFAENVAQAYAGRELAQQVESDVRMNKTGFIVSTLKIPLTVFNKATQLNTLQRAAFRQALHEKLDQQLNSLFGEEK